MEEKIKKERKGQIEKMNTEIQAQIRRLNIEGKNMTEAQRNDLEKKIQQDKAKMNQLLNEQKASKY